MSMSCFCSESSPKTSVGGGEGEVKFFVEVAMAAESGNGVGNYSRCHSGRYSHRLHLSIRAAGEID